MTSIDSNAALSATPCSLEHENVATVRRLTAMRSSRNLMSMAVLHLRSMLIAACKGGYSTPRDSYALVTQSNVDGNAAFAAAACSLEHARAATVRRVTATRSSRHLSMAMLRWQQRSMLIGACNGGSTAPRVSYALITPSAEGNAALAATACSLDHSIAATDQCAALQLCARHTICRWQCCVGSNSMLIVACKCMCGAIVTSTQDALDGINQLHDGSNKLGA